MNVAQRIRDRQRRSIEAFGVSETAWNRMQEENLLKFKLGCPGVDIGPLPTDIQSPVEYFILSHLLDRAKSTASKLGKWRDGAQVTIASEAAGNINGYCFTEKTGESGIVIDTTLIKFYRFISNVAIKLMVTEDGDIDFSKECLLARAESASEPSNDFYSLLCSCVEKGDTFIPNTNAVDPSQKPFVEELSEGMGLFIIGHELGHISLAHTNDTVMKKDGDEFLQELMDDGKAKYIYRHMKEMEADSFSTNIVLNALFSGGIDRDLGIFGPTLFLISLEVFERFLFFGLFGHSRWANIGDALGQLVGSFELVSTHPPPHMRFFNIQRAIVESSLPIWIRESIRLFTRNMWAAMINLEEDAERRVAERGYPLAVHKKWLAYKHEYEALRDLGAGFLTTSGKVETGLDK